MTTHALTLADEFFDRAKEVPGFSTFHRAPVQTVNDGDLPMLGVFIMGETWTADGDDNAGAPHFKHTLTIGITCADAATVPEDQLRALELMADSVLTRLLTDASLFNQQLFDGISRIERRLAWTRVGETPLAEQQIRIDVTFGSIWEPVVTDDLEGVTVKTIYPGPSTSENPTNDLNIEQRYELDT